MSQSELIFNPETGLYAPDTSDIREAVVQDWTQAFADPDQPTLDTEPTTPAGQLIDSETAIIEDKNAQILFLSNMFNPRTSEGRWQDALGYIYFLERQIETPSVVTCQLTGLAGTVVPAGALAQTTDGITLASDAAVTIGSNGTATVIFSSQETGPVAIAAHSATSIVTVIPGWDTIDNDTAGVPGRIRESRSEFEQRRYASVAANAHGTIAAMYGTIGNLPGVVDLVILENIGPYPLVEWGVTVPGHGVFISVYGGEDEKIAEAIYRKKDAGCDTGGNTQVSYTDTEIQNYRGGVIYTYNIERPDPLPFSVQVTIRKTLTTPANIVDRIKAVVLDDFNGSAGKDRVRMAATCYASRFYCPIMAVGVQNILGVKIAAPPASPWVDEVVVNADRIPVLDIDDITVLVI